MRSIHQSRQDKLNILTISSVLGVAAIAGSFSVTTVYADDTSVVTTTTISVPVSCTLSSSVDSAHSAEIANGTYQENIGKTTIKTFCNDANGYALYAVGYTGDTMTGDNHTKLMGSSTGTNISTGTYTAGTTTDSVWSMKLTSVTGTYAPTIASPYTGYSAIPASFTKVASYNQGTDAINGTGSSIETTYAAYVNNTQSADTYTGKVKYVLVHPNSFAAGNYSVVYKPNGGTGTDVTISNIANYEPYTIAASTFTAPTGYQFVGWCTVQDNTQSPQTSCTGGTLYQPDDIATSLASAGGTFNLYATWSKLLTLADATNMQDLATADYCTGTTIGDTTTLTDSRDGTSYTVGKLADGKCWMLDNLALDITSSTVLGGMNNTNTNASDTTLGYLKGTSTGTTSDKYATAAVSNWTSSYSYSAPLVNMTNKDIVPQGDDPMAAQALAGNWKVGGYYNYCAASAGSYCYGDGTSYGTSSGNATESICPAGWRMPTGFTSGEYSALANAIYGSTSSTSDATAYANYRSALHLPLSGYLLSGSPYNQGSGGYWWSSTRYGNDTMYYLYANTSTIYPASYYGRRIGLSLRCMAGS